MAMLRVLRTGAYTWRGNKEAVMLAFLRREYTVSKSKQREGDGSCSRVRSHVLRVRWVGCVNAAPSYAHTTTPLPAGYGEYTATKNHTLRQAKYRREGGVSSLPNQLCIKSRSGLNPASKSTRNDTKSRYNFPFPISHCNQLCSSFKPPVYISSCQE